MFKDIDEELVLRMKDFLQYNHETGVFTWKRVTSKRVKVGQEAGRINNAGHIGIGFEGSRWQAHRLAVAFIEGSLSGELEIDHKDQNKINNRYMNLRKATKQQNSCNRGSPRNNTSGVKGMSFNINAGKWEGYVHFNSKKYYLGLFTLEEDCKEAIQLKRKELHKEFASS